MRFQPRFRFPLRLPHAALLCCALLAACGDKTAQDGDATHPTVDTLPAPADARGPITGMPDTPGPGPVASDPAEALPPDAMVEPDEMGLGEGTVDPELEVDPDAVSNDEETAAPEPTPEDAVAVVRAYYGAIEARSFDRAYALWADEGRASQQTPQQFAAGFARTARIAVSVDAPGRVEGAAGSRFVEVPVAIEATQDDGTVRRYVGAYTLRRSMVDGASPEQREWRIASADIREVTQ